MCGKALRTSDEKEQARSDKHFEDRELCGKGSTSQPDND